MTNATQTTREEPYCGQLGPRRSPTGVQYRCTEPDGHKGDHVAGGNYAAEGEYDRWAPVGQTNGTPEYRLETTEAGRALSNRASALWWQPNPLAGANAMQSATAEVREAILAIEDQAATEAHTTCAEQCACWTRGHEQGCEPSHD